MLANLSLDAEGLTFSASADDASRVVDLLLEGRRVWSFKVADAAPVTGDRVRVPWPVPLRHGGLAGVGTFCLRPLDGGADQPSASIRFGGSDQPLRFEDRYGIGLVVNKFGRTGHALADYDPGMITRLLDNLDTVRTTLEEGMALPVFVMSGTLLGPYRDGRIMPHDDDADLGYLSTLSHPADVVREAFQVGRVLRAAGLQVIRASGGHVQIHFTHEGRPDAYVDVFTGFIDDDGWWQHPFAIRLRATRDQVLPLSTLDVHGRPEPAPRSPELMLEANYGPGWKVPDPAYRFDIPPAAERRFYGWFGDYGMDRTLWEDHYRYDLAGDRVPLGSAPSGYAQWLDAQVAPGSAIVDLGAGRGHDALWLAGRGHRVEAVDYVRWPMTTAAQVAEQQGLDARFTTANLYELRRVLRLGSELAARREPLTVLASGLLGSFWDIGRPTLFRLLSMLLRSGGTAHLDVPGTSLLPDPAMDLPLHRSVPVEVLRDEMARFDLVITDLHEGTEPVRNMPWVAAEPLPTTRMVVSWQRSRR